MYTYIYEIVCLAETKLCEDIQTNIKNDNI